MPFRIGGERAMEYQYLVSDVLKAMQKHELKVYYQPKFDALTNRL